MSPAQHAFIGAFVFFEVVGLVWLYMDGEPRGTELGVKFVAMELVVMMLSIFVAAGGGS